VTEFNSTTDIGNRALQHCGATRMDPTTGLDENSAGAAEVRFAYPKVRRAELRRNVWRFATRKAALRPIDTDTMFLSAALWREDTTYFRGSIVSDENTNFWISREPDNLGNQPEDSATWEPYFGPRTADLYDSTVSYCSGELVYATDGDGTVRVYLSLLDNNDEDPETATAWDATTTFYKNQVVTYLTIPYMSRIDWNKNQTPTSSAANWSSATSYTIGQAVTGTDGVRYTSLTNPNLNHDPTTDDGTRWTNTGILTPWTSVFTGGSGSVQWLLVGGTDFPAGVTLVTPNIVYPLGSGPASQSLSRNVYVLPFGFLREAPQDPRAGSFSALGAPSGLGYTDWNYEGDYIVSAETGVIVYRFVADVTDVAKMDDMFCEGLAARVALSICERLTQSGAKLQTISSVYDKFMKEARAVNAIETGATEPPMDDYLACRF
jgi:hypothetical protein